jgi:hypothetical protein
MVKTLLAAITATVLLASSAAPLSAQYRYRGGYGYGGWHGGWWNGGTGAALGLGLGLGFLGGLWQLLPTTRLRITEHPVMATPPLQPPRQSGTGVIHTSNITHMYQIARLRGGKSCNEMWSGGVRAVSRPAPLSVASPRTLRLCAVGSRSRCSFVIPASSTRNPGLPNLLDFQGAHWQRT